MVYDCNNGYCFPKGEGEVGDGLGFKRNTREGGRGVRQQTKSKDCKNSQPTQQSVAEEKRGGRKGARHGRLARCEVGGQVR